MENNYLIPANSKKSQLILGFFTPVDLVLFSVGAVLSFLMLLLSKSITLVTAVLMMLPALIGTFLVMPVPHYHNILQLLINVYNFYMNRRQYYWKGWCIYEEFSSNSNKQ